MAVAEQVISRIKVMSELDIAERRVPQDGRFSIALDRRPIDFRVSDHSQHLRRRRGAARARQAGAHRAAARPAARCLGLRHAGRHSVAALEFATLRHAAGHRAHRQRQDHHPVCRDFRDPDRVRQDRHHRGSGRIPAAGRAADSGQREEGFDLRPRTAVHSAPRPRQDHGGRNPRFRDRANRHPIGADRSPGIHHGARQQCVRRGEPLHAHGRRYLQFRVRACRACWRSA